MSKIIFFNMMTVDGFLEGVNKEIDWNIRRTDNFAQSHQTKNNLL
jgi:hypothetical protein